jgi:hypothetical protein
MSARMLKTAALAAAVLCGITGSRPARADATAASFLAPYVTWAANKPDGQGTYCLQITMVTNQTNLVASFSNTVLPYYHYIYWTGSYFAIANGFSAKGSGAAPTGEWEGKLAAGETTLRLVVHLQQGGNGKLSGTMDSPDQGASGLPLRGVRVTGGSVRFLVPSIHGEYSGKLAKDGSGMSGKWWQGVTVPLSLTKAK